MAVALKGPAGGSSTNAMIARSMGMGGNASASAGAKKDNSGAVNPGHSKMPAASAAAAAAKLPPAPTAKGIELGLPSAMKALAARKDGGAAEAAAAAAAKPPPSAKGKTVGRKEGDSDDDDDDDEKGFGLDDDKEAVAKFREKRIAELKAQSKKQQEFAALGHGTYTEIKEDEFLPSVTKSKYAICHFYHPHFERCKIFDKHLRELSAIHTATKFMTLNADKAPFFVTKLAIQVLPTIVCFKDGVAVDRVTGFEELGNKDDFPIGLLAKRLAKKGIIVLTAAKADKPDAANSIRAATNNNANEPTDDS